MSLRGKLDWLLGQRAMEAAGAEIARRAAEHMAATARCLAPVDTGALVNSITVVAPSGSASTHVVATAPYAAYVELGHLAGGVTWVPPNPFMRNAMATTAAAFPQIAKGVRLGVPGEDNTLQHLGVSIATT